jgi:hypothetical protein
MVLISPKLKAVVVASNTIPGEFSVRAIKGTKQVPVQLAIKDAGFVPGDVIEISILDDKEDLDLVDKVKELERAIANLEDCIDRARCELG